MVLGFGGEGIKYPQPLWTAACNLPGSAASSLLEAHWEEGPFTLTDPPHSQECHAQFPETAALPSNLCVVCIFLYHFVHSLYFTLMLCVFGTKMS